MLRIVHYLNQFFGQIGGEEKADIGPVVKPGAVGPGMALRGFLEQGEGEVVATVICGDNYFVERMDRVAKEITAIIKEQHPDLVIAGPAYEAGRYGLACGRICVEVQNALNIPAVTGMFKENPGVSQYRSQIYIVTTGNVARTIKDDLGKMLRLGIKLANKEPLGLPLEEGYFAQGYLRTVVSYRSAGVRAIDMLLQKVKGEPWETEIPLPEIEEVPPAQPVKNLLSKAVAVVTDGGLTGKGNPDKLPSIGASHYTRIEIGGLDDLVGGEYEVHHGGYYNGHVYDDPDRLVPVDVLRRLEGIAFGKLHECIYSTCGLANTRDNCQKVGREIAAALQQSSVEAAILTST